MKLRLVKFLTSRENEIEKKEEGGRSTTIMRSASTQPGRSQSPAPFSLSSSLHLSTLSSSTILRQQVSSPPFQLVGRHVPPSSCSSYPSSSCFASPFLLHKITEATRYGGRRVALYSTCRPSLPVQLADCGRPARRTLAPSPNQVPRLLSGSNGILSVAGGAIGKQRPKMRFSVSFPSLLNK